VSTGDERERFVVLRWSPSATMQASGAQVPGWETVGSSIFHDRKAAREFAGKLDHARVFELVPAPDEPD